MAITLDAVKALMPFSRVGFTYTSAHKMLVGGTDGTSSREVYPLGVAKVSHFVVGVGTELHYSDMVRRAALAQNVSERSLAESFVGQPLRGYEWVDGYVGALLRATRTGDLQLRGYAVDDDGRIPSHDTRYIDVATGETLDFDRDLRRYQSQSPSAQRARDIQYLTIDCITLHSVDGTPIFRPACKNFSLAGITDLVVDP